MPATLQKPPARKQQKQAADSRAARLPLLAIAIFAAFCAIPRIDGNPRLLFSFIVAAAALLVTLIFLRISVKRARRALTYKFVPVKVHWVQMLMHSSIYAYWGWYWPEVYSHIPLILAQVAFVYALDMMVCWFRRDNWALGFGPFPIVLSTNLFLWFRDDWFWLQFLMMAAIVICKEFIRWDRDGERKHIFNPSAIALFFFSLGLLFTNSTGITWGPEIARTLHLPPYIYPEIFLVGMVVQGLFSVTLVTLASAAVLYGLNLAYTQSTGVFLFVDSNIPVSVFIGLHLLVTDPATSPRRITGKIIFGAMYGAAVFALYALLGHYQAPQFYDKLLCVPFLNLTVRALDRFSQKFAAAFHPLNLLERFGPRRLNYAHMGIWAVLFGTMMLTGFMGQTHPGQSVAFWQKACVQSRYNACTTFVHALRTECENGSGPGCMQYGRELKSGTHVKLSKLESGEALARACDLKQYQACFDLTSLLGGDGVETFSNACERGDNVACFIIGRAFAQGLGLPRNDEMAIGLFQRACGNGFTRACASLGQSYMAGRGRAPNPAAALPAFEQACAGGDPSSCYNAGALYTTGQAGVRNISVAQDRFRQACGMGMKNACQIVEAVEARLKSRQPN
jgi:hypothetical protein